MKLFLHFLLVFFLPVFTWAQWQDTNWPHLENSNLTSMNFVTSLLKTNGRMFACSSDGLFISENNGTSWNKVNGLTPDYRASTILESDKGLFLVMSKLNSPFRMWKNEDKSGQKWEEINAPSFYSYLIQVGNDLFILGSGKAARLDKSTNQWVDIGPTQGATYRFTWHRDTIYQSMYQDKYLYRSTDGGRTYQKMTNFRMEGFQVTDGLIIGQLLNNDFSATDSLIFSRNSGQSWQKLHVKINKPFYYLSLMKYEGKIYVGVLEQFRLYDLDLTNGNIVKTFEGFFPRPSVDLNGQYGAIDGDCHINYSDYRIYKTCPDRNFSYLTYSPIAPVYYDIPEMYSHGDSLLIAYSNPLAYFTDNSIQLVTSKNTTPRKLAPVEYFGATHGNSFAYRYDTLYSVNSKGSKLIKYHILSQKSTVEPGFPDSNIYQIASSTELLGGYNAIKKRLYYRKIKGKTWSTINNVTHFAGNADRLYFVQPDFSTFGSKIFRIADNGTQELLATIPPSYSLRLFDAHDSIIMYAVRDSAKNNYVHNLYLSSKSGKDFRVIDLRPLANAVVLNGYYRRGNLYLHTNMGLQAYNEAKDLWVPYYNGLPDFPSSLGLLGDTLYVGIFEDGLFKRGTSPIFATRGRIFLDENSNGMLDAGEKLLPDIGVRSSLTKGVFYSNASGYYSSATGFSRDTHTILLPNPKLIATPAQIITDAADVQRNFALTVPGNERDAGVDLSIRNEFRPGFNTPLAITIKNYLLRQNNNIVTLTFEPDKLRYVLGSSNPASIDTINGILRWSFSVYEPLSEISLSPIFKTKTTTPIQANIAIAVSTQSDVPDANAANNTALVNATVIGSFDPNDKLVSKGQLTIQSNPIQERLTYTIRFQNTGTADALFVNLFDTLSVEDFDINSLEILNASHSYVARILDNNVLKVTFDKIYLPPKVISEALSQGFFTFSIRTKRPVTTAGLIRNRAGIYFDFNAVVLTPYAETKITFLSNTQPTLLENAIKLYPNPANEGVWIEWLANSTNQLRLISIFDINGRLLSSQAFRGEKHFISLVNHPKGILMIRFEMDKGIVNRYIIRQ